MISVTVVLTVHNRLDCTLSCLNSLFECSLHENLFFSVFIVDDGSTDGTTEYLKVNFPSVTVIQGDGQLFWNGGMRLCIEYAVRKNPNSGLLLLNNDVMLTHDWSTRLTGSIMSIGLNHCEYLLVGTCFDPSTLLPSYGGKNQAGELLFSESMHLHAHTMNGNFVFIPVTALQKLGNLSSDYLHAYGDSDYCLRALKLGIPTYVIPGFIGKCSWHDEGIWSDPSYSLVARWKHFHSPTGLYPKDFFRFQRKWNSFSVAFFRLANVYFRMIFGIQKNTAPKYVKGPFDKSG